MILWLTHTRLSINCWNTHTNLIMGIFSILIPTDPHVSTTEPCRSSEHFRPTIRKAGRPKNLMADTMVIVKPWENLHCGEKGHPIFCMWFFFFLRITKLSWVSIRVLFIGQWLGALDRVPGDARTGGPTFRAGMWAISPFRRDNRDGCCVFFELWMSKDFLSLTVLAEIQVYTSYKSATSAHLMEYKSIYNH